MYPIGGDGLWNRSWRWEASNIRAEFAKDISLVKFNFGGRDSDWL